MNDLATLRDLVLAHRPRRARDGYPDAVRGSVVKAARTAMGQGVSLRAFAGRVELALPTVQRWLETPTHALAATFVPVHVTRSPSAPDATADRAPVVWVTPSGHRIEGLSIEHVAELLRRVA